MRRLILGGALCLLLSGCTARRVRSEAALALECRKGAVEVRKDSEHGSWIAEGCGRQAICMEPGASGGEVRCEGGGPTRTLQSSAPQGT